MTNTNKPVINEEELRQQFEAQLEKGEEGNRAVRGGAARFARFLAIAYALFHLYTAAFGAFPNLIQRSIHVGFALMLTYLLYAGSRRGQGTGRVPWYDVLAIAFSAFAAGYVSYNYYRFTVDVTSSNTFDLIMAALTILVLLEASRRVIGWAFPILATLFMLYAYYGRSLPMPWTHAGFELRPLLEYLFMSTQGIWGVTTRITSTEVAVYIIFGAFLLVTGGGRTFMDLALVLAGRSVGGPAKVSTVASSFFGTISGSAAANVAVTGSFTIPMMRRLNYGNDFAGAVEATASSGGQIMPPIMGAGAFVMAELLGVPYVDIVVAAALPALLYYGGVFVAIHFDSERRGLRGLPNELIPGTRDLIRFDRLAPFLTPIFILLYLLFSGFTPMRAGFWAIVTAAVLYLVSDFNPGNMLKRLSQMVNALEQGGYGLVLIALLAGTAQIIVGIISFTGFGARLSGLIIEASGGQLLLALVLSMLVALILGMGMPTTAAYLLGASVLVPALTRLDVLPLAAHMFVFYFAIISAITPPVCVAVFVAAGMAEGNWMRTAWIACRLGIAAFIIPYMFVYANELLLIGETGDIILAAITALIGVMGLAGGVMGYFRRRNHPIETIVLIASALSLIHPGIVTDIVGVVGVLLVYGVQKFLPMRAAGATAP